MTWDKEKEIAKIISLRMTGTVSPEQESELERWLEMSPENRAVYEELVSGKYSEIRQKLEEETDVPGELRRVKLRAHRIMLRRRWISAVSASAAAVAAAVLILSPGKPGPEPMAMKVPGGAQAVLRVGNAAPVLLGAEDSDSTWMDYVDGEPESEVEVAKIKITVPNGGEYKLRLPDGTVIWLNSESSIEYPAVFSDRERAVTLSGEGYFEVAHESERPFVLSTERASITVLGTSFNVSAYLSDEYTTATLISGSIQLSNATGSVELVPGNQASVASSSGQIDVRDVDPGLYAAWITGVFEFENLPLEEICARLSRWYGVSFEFTGTSAEERCTGAIWKNKPLGEFLSGIELVTNLTFEYQDEKVIVSYAE